MSAAPAKRSIFIRPFLWLGSRPAALWARTRPQPRTLRAISWTACLAAIALGGYVGRRSNVGADLLVLFGYQGPPVVGTEELWFDLGAGGFATILLVLIGWLLVALIGRISRWLPTATGRIGAGALLTIAFLISEAGFPIALSLSIGALVVLLLGLVVGSIASLTSGKFGDKRWFGKTTVWTALILGVASVGAIGYGAVHEGTRSHLTTMPVYAAEFEPAELSIADPGAAGPITTIQTLTYGSGTDLHRPEFGAEADLKTEPVNGKPFAKLPDGHQGKKRKLFWQLSMTEMPLNGRVWYPSGDGPFPLVLIVHGNHSMREFSDTGYEYLGEHLASHGYILCSVDQNFINGDMRKENDARGWLLLEHLKVWQAWNTTAGNPLFGKVDLDNIALIGHSRGGEAVTHAALFNTLKHYPDDASVDFDYGFAIKSIVSIAPVDGQYKPGGRYTRLRDVNYFTIHGSHDADVTQFYGDRIFNRLTFREGSQYFKSTLYVYRANHGQFNTVWGATDAGPPRSLLLNRTALLDGEDQRQIAKVYITAFLQATLRAKREYIPLFVNPRTGRHWLPEATMISRFEDPSFRLIADFEEDADVTTASVPGGTIRSNGLVVYRESDVAMRGGGKRYNQGAYLGWNTEPAKEDEKAAAEVAAVAVAVEASARKSEPNYTIDLPEGFMRGLNLSGDEQLVLHIAEVKEKPEAKDYSAEANDEDDDDDDDDDDEDPNGDNENNDDEEQEGGDAAKTTKEPPLALDFSVELTAPSGAVRLPLSRFGMLAPPLEAVTSRAPFLQGSKSKKTETTLQVFALPLADFQASEPTLDLSTVTAIRLIFDLRPKGVIVVDRIGIANRPQ